MRFWILLGIASAAGALLRYGVVRMFDRWRPGFPWGTLAVNVAGAFLAGALLVLCRAKFQEYERFFPVIFAGFLGAFTTFSAFALESARYWDGAQYGKFMLNLLLQNLIGVAAAGVGLWTARQWTA